jgi:aldose 1-epimerase
MKKQLSLIFFTGMTILSACNTGPGNTATSNMKAAITERSFGLLDGQPVTQYTLANSNGMQVSIINYGGTVTNILVPDRDKKMGDVVLGFDSLPGYLQKTNPYFGCLVGRYANRIDKGKFTIDGKAYQLPLNDHGLNTLHGGVKGFDKVVWQATKLSDSSLQLTYTSKDGEEGFPGNLKAVVVYTLTAANELKIAYSATTDQPTPVNLTNHSYFNLSAGKEPTILNHELWINANQFTEVNEQLIPTGKSPDVKGGPMDFTAAKPIGRDIAAVKGGYDHNWLLNKKANGLEKAVTLYDPASGRQLEVFTTEPGIQFYTGNFLDSTLKGKNNWVYAQHAALCLETQHYPDSPNQPSFPGTILKPGETYTHTTVFRFSVK